MAEFNDTYRKAGILMKSALKKYEKGDFEGGNRDRKEANRLYDLAEKEVDSVQGTTMLYGENRNFGTIYKVFESNTSKLFNDKKEKGKLKKVLDLIKENKILKSEFDVYNALVYPKSVTNADKYVNEALSIMPDFNKKDIIENNDKFIKLIREMKLDELVDISDEDMNLFEAVEYVMINKESFDNINEFVNAKKCITEHIEKNCQYKEVENKPVDEIYNDGINNISEKYDSLLNDDEKKLIESLSKVENKEEYFNTSKKEALDVLNEQKNVCDDENRDKMNRIIENITNREYSENKFISDIAEFTEIKNTLE